VALPVSNSFALLLFASLFLAPRDFCEGCTNGTLFCRTRQLISLFFNRLRTLCKNTRGVPPAADTTFRLQRSTL